MKYSIIKFRQIQKNKKWREDFPVYFVSGAEDLPFMNLEDWKDLLVYTYKKADGNGDKEYALTYEVSEDGKTVTLTRETGYNMIVDFEAGTFTFLDFVAFVQPANLPYMEIGGPPETMNGQPFLLQTKQERNLYGEMTIDNYAHFYDREALTEFIYGHNFQLPT